MATNEYLPEPMNEGDDYPTPPPYRGNPSGRTGFIITLCCTIIPIVCSLFWAIMGGSSEVMRVWISVSLAFLFLMDVLGLILSIRGIRKYPKGMAIAGTIIGGISVYIYIQVLLFLITAIITD